MAIRKATKEDYEEIQGGMPTVEKQGKLTIVNHDYEGGNNMHVASHIDHGTVILQTKKGPVEFIVDLLRRFHGDPCEQQSRSVGGEGYPRTKV